MLHSVSDPHFSRPGMYHEKHIKKVLDINIRVEIKNYVLERTASCGTLVRCGYSQQGRLNVFSVVSKADSVCHLAIHRALYYLTFGCVRTLKWKTDTAISSQVQTQVLDGIVELSNLKRVIF